jgi:hypothetical protein
MDKTIEDKLNILVARVKRVRRWLMALVVLKIAALCLIFVSVYVGIYVWLDHRLNFGTVGRITGFTLLVSGIALLLYLLARLLIVHISCSETANYIESRNSFNQQLVTAIEYYENKHDYPYSKDLAECLVLQTDRNTEAFSFDSTVEKWRALVFSAIILFGLGTVCFYVKDNYTYFARLTRPLAAIDPVLVTSLESVTTDIVTKPDSQVMLRARIKGRLPESGNLVLAPFEDTNEVVPLKDKAVEILQLKPSFDEQAIPHFQASKSFAQPGQLRYRFESGPASTNWHDITIALPPAVKNITAEVTLPTGRQGTKRSEPYTEQIKGNTLEVILSSKVTLNVQTTNLQKAIVTGLDGESSTYQLNGKDQFTFDFVVDRTGSIKFSLVSEEGLASGDLRDLEVRVKTDKPPRLKLISPNGDYLATDVASVPLTFEISDDFGLKSAKMHLEIPNQQIQDLDIPLEKRTRKTHFTYILELEEYDLTVGDSILYFAEAVDLQTSPAQENQTAASSMYFIEIRPYRQRWHPKAGGKSNAAGMAVTKLLDILEYTRAILKKTWAITKQSKLTEHNISKLDLINEDVRYCARELVDIRDDPEQKFNSHDKNVLNQILQNYEQASRHLAGHDASSAIPPEKNAYLALRKFIVELEMELNPPQSGSSVQKKEPEKIKLQENVRPQDMERERIADELKKMQHGVEKVAKDQHDLKKAFEDLLEERMQKQKSAKQTSNGQSKAAAEEKAAEAKAAEAKATEAKATGTKATGTKASGTKASGTKAASGKSQTGSQSPTNGQGDGQTRQLAQSKAVGKAGTAGLEQRLKMLQAKQATLQEKTLQLKEQLKQIPKNPEDARAEARAEVQKHLDEAIEQMSQSQKKLTKARYEMQINRQKSADAVETLKSVGDELDMTAKALEAELMSGDKQSAAEKAREMAKKLVEDAASLDESVTPIERELMLARLEAAKRLLEQMPTPQWTTVNRSDKKDNVAKGLVLTQSPAALREAARAMAREFWSIAINAKKRVGPLIEREPSDVKFYEFENEFFETAAKFNQKPVQK